MVYFPNFEYFKLETWVNMKPTWKIWYNLNIFLKSFFSLMIVLLICYFSSFYDFRFDLNKNSNYLLSSRTISIIKSLSNSLDIKILIDRNSYLYEDIENLLSEYIYHSDLIDISWVDPVKNPALAEQLGVHYEINNYPLVIIDNGFTHRLIPEDQLREIDFKTGKIISFNAEKAITSALIEIQNNIMPKVYFLYGHGENRINDISQKGFSSLISIFSRDAIKLESFELNGFKSIPSDADAVVLPGPKRMLNKSSIAIIEEYLSRGGRLMVMIDSFYESGLDDMMRKWGVSIPQGFVFDQAQTLRGRDVNVNNFGAHPINDGVDSIVKLILPSPIIPISTKENPNNLVDIPNIKTLLKSSDNSWIETGTSLKTPVYNENLGDLLGPIQLSLAIEKGSSKELDLEIKSSRIVVIGDSDFITNVNLIEGNIKFLKSSINWLLDRTNLVDINSKKISDVRIAISENYFLRYFILSIIIIPILPIIFCIIVFFWRNK